MSHGVDTSPLSALVPGGEGQRGDCPASSGLGRRRAGGLRGSLERHRVLEQQLQIKGQGTEDRWT